MRLTLLLPLLAACASAPTPVAPPEPAPAPEPPAATAPAAPVTPALDAHVPGLPWLLAEDVAALGPLPVGMPLPKDPPTQTGQYGIVSLVKPISKEALPASLRAHLGKRLMAYKKDGEPTCEVIVAGYRARREYDPEGGEGAEVLYPDTMDMDGNEITPEPEAIRFQRGFDEGPLTLVAVLTRVDGSPYEGACSEGDQDFLVGPPGLSHLPRDQRDTPQTRALDRAAIAAFKQHPFWEQQQHDYQRSIELERTRARKAYEDERADAKASGASRAELAAIERDDRADRAPRTWDAPAGRYEFATDSGPEVQRWGDEAAIRFVVVALGNDVSCAAPRAWMVFEVEGSALAPVAFGVGAAPAGFIDLDGDGAFEATFDAWYDRRVDHLDPALDDPSLRRVDLPGGGQHCAWEQIPPLPEPDADTP